MSLVERLDVFGLALVVAAYLVGSISWSYLVVRRLLGLDVRSVGSGNAGATNVLRTTGPGPGLAVLALDVAKGAIPVAIGRRLGLDPATVGAVAFATVVGHVYPVFFGFRGGKGVATAGGALGAFTPVPGVLAVVVFLVVVYASRYVSLGSVATAVLFPLLVWIAGRYGWVPEAEEAHLGVLVGWTGAIAALVVWKHRANLARLRNGTERRLGERHA